MNFLVKMMNFWFKMMNSFTLQVEQVGAMAIILNSVSVLQVRFRLISDYFSTVFGRFVLNSVSFSTVFRLFLVDLYWILSRFCSSCGPSPRQVREEIHPFCIQNDGFVIQNDGFSIQNDGFSIQNDMKMIYFTGALIQTIIEIIKVPILYWKSRKSRYELILCWPITILNWDDFLWWKWWWFYTVKSQFWAEKMLVFGRGPGYSWFLVHLHGWVKMRNFVSKNEKLCLKNEKLCIKKRETFKFKIMNFVVILIGFTCAFTVCEPQVTKLDPHNCG